VRGVVAPCTAPVNPPGLVAAMACSADWSLACDESVFWPFMAGPTGGLEAGFLLEKRCSVISCFTVSHLAVVDAFRAAGNAALLLLLAEPFCVFWSAFNAARLCMGA
jgi:hypothetical protein